MGMTQWDDLPHYLDNRASEDGVTQREEM